jgi:hypothetical protein
MNSRGSNGAGSVVWSSRVKNCVTSDLPRQRPA